MALTSDRSWLFDAHNRVTQRKKLQRPASIEQPRLMSNGREYEVSPRDLPADRMKAYLVTPRKGMGPVLRLGFSMCCYARLWKACGQPDVFGYAMSEIDGLMMFRPAHLAFKAQSDGPWKEVARKCEPAEPGKASFCIESWTVEAYTKELGVADKFASASMPEVIAYEFDEADGSFLIEVPKRFYKEPGA